MPENSIWNSGRAIGSGLETPLGIADIVQPVFLNHDIPIYMAHGRFIGKSWYDTWNIYMIGAMFAEDNLTPVTRKYAFTGDFYNDTGGLWTGQNGIGWYCYRFNTVEAAILAWDYEPFLYYVHWTPGIANVTEKDDPNWLYSRRQWCYMTLLKTGDNFLKEFFDQFTRDYDNLEENKSPAS